MAALSSEGLAGIRLLICMAKADATLKPEERYILEDALAGVTLPEGLNIEALLAENNDPVDLAKQISDHDARDCTYASVFAMAHCDRHLDEREKVLLATLRGAWGIRAEEEDGLKQALERGLGGTAAPQSGSVRQISDAKARAAEFQRMLARYCLLTGVTGAIPIPLVPDLLVVPIQVKLVHDVAALFGQGADRDAVRLMFETLGVGTGARLGISALAKLVPGWGSVVGATSSFATTYALGKVAYSFFESGGKRSVEDLREMFEQERERGKEEYRKQKPAMEEAQKHHAKTLQQLAFDVQAQKITPEEYEKRVDALK